MIIVTAVVNNLEFIEMQYASFKKHVKGDYKFIVFNDAKDFPDSTNNGDVTLRCKIEEFCSTLGITCINIPNDHHKTMQIPSIRAADSMNYILQYQIRNPDKYLCLDSDMFLIADMDVANYSDYDCALVMQHRILPILKKEPAQRFLMGNRKTPTVQNVRVDYFWCGVCYFDMTKMKDHELLNWNCRPGCDTGGMMNAWLVKQASYANTDNEMRVYFINHLASCDWSKSMMPAAISPNLSSFIENDPRNVNGKFFCEIYDNKFLHYRGGSNWQNNDEQLYNDTIANLKGCLLE